MFFCEFCAISNSLSYRTHLVTASVTCRYSQTAVSYILKMRGCTQQRILAHQQIHLELPSQQTNCTIPRIPTHCSECTCRLRVTKPQGQFGMKTNCFRFSRHSYNNQLWICWHPGSTHNYILHRNQAETVQQQMRSCILDTGKTEKNINLKLSEKKFLLRTVFFAHKNKYTKKLLYLTKTGKQRDGWKPLTIITKSSTLDVAAVLDPPLKHN